MQQYEAYNLPKVQARLSEMTRLLADEHQVSRAEKSITPINIESPFSVDELFFSITDKKGFILAGNSVFARVSKYRLDEMVGKPHNLIRHPDTPRIVFKLLWEFIEEGLPVAAYVKNMASDGSYYWVLAAVVPIEGGYVSVRIKPSMDDFHVIQSLYAELRAAENAIESQPDGRRSAAMEASRNILTQRLNELGFHDYQHFMQTRLAEEIALRNRLVPHRGGIGNLDKNTIDHDIIEMLHISGELEKSLTALVDQIDTYNRLGADLNSKSNYVLQLADDIRLFSLNALIETSHLNEINGAALGAVAMLMRDRSAGASGIINELNEDINAVLAQLDDISFRIAITQLQVEGLGIFLKELIEQTELKAAKTSTLHSLHTSLLTRFGELFPLLAGFATNMRSVIARVGGLQRELQAMQSLQTNGRIEAARVNDASSFIALFDSIHQQVTMANDEMTSFLKLASAAVHDYGSLQTTTKLLLESLKNHID